MASKNQRRKRGDDRAAEHKAQALNQIGFWDQIRSRYTDEARALADAAIDSLSLRDLRAMEAAEMVDLDRMLADTASHKQRAIIRNAMVQCRKNLRALVLAGAPSLDLNDVPARPPEGLNDEDRACIDLTMAGDHGNPFIHESGLVQRVRIEQIKLQLIAERSPRAEGEELERLEAQGRAAATALDEARRALAALAEAE